MPIHSWTRIASKTRSTGYAAGIYCKGKGFFIMREDDPRLVQASEMMHTHEESTCFRLLGSGTSNSVYNRTQGNNLFSRISTHYAVRVSREAGKLEEIHRESRLALWASSVGFGIKVKFVVLNCLEERGKLVPDECRLCIAMKKAVTTCYSVMMKCDEEDTKTAMEAAQKTLTLIQRASLAGLLHLDCKPGNVLLVQQGANTNMKMIDFDGSFAGERPDIDPRVVFLINMAFFACHMRVSKVKRGPMSAWRSVWTPLLVESLRTLRQEAHLPSAAWLFNIKCREAKRPDPLVPLDVAQTIELGASLNWVCCAYFHGSKTGAAPSWRGWQKTGHPDSVPLIMQMVGFATERTP